MAEERLDIVGLRDIAKLLQVDGRTPSIWRSRNLLPVEDGFISGNVPVWRRPKILAWAKNTGRLPSNTPAGRGHKKGTAAVPTAPRPRTGSTPPARPAVAPLQELSSNAE